LRGSSQLIFWVSNVRKYENFRPEKEPKEESKMQFAEKCEQALRLALEQNSLQPFLAIADEARENDNNFKLANSFETKACRELYDRWSTEG
jgi:hypothetical protein